MNTFSAPLVSAPLTPAAQVVLAHRRYFLSLAYNILGSRGEAEDIVQDVVTRVITSPDLATIQNPKAYCARSVVNRSLNRKERMQREVAESYWGVWLPEPVAERVSERLTEQTADDRAEDAMDEFDTPNAVSLGLLRLMETLSPAERAVFVLVELFNESYHTTAEMLEATEANCRKLMQRAKEKLESGKKRFTASQARHEELFHAFATASTEGRFEDLYALLKEDVVMYSDGGGKVTAARIPLVGREKIIRGLQNILTWAASAEPSFYVPCRINGRFGVVAVHKETQQPLAALTIEADEDGITELYSVRNPDKLAFLRV